MTRAGVGQEKGTLEPQKLLAESRLPRMTEHVRLPGPFLSMWCTSVCGSKYKTAPCVGFQRTGKECMQRTHSVHGGRAGLDRIIEEGGFASASPPPDTPCRPRVLLRALLTQRCSVTVGQARWWPRYLPPGFPFPSNFSGILPRRGLHCARAGLQRTRPGL